jgi:hypothetical protein
VSYTYQRVGWATDNPAMPVEIYSELDAERWEIRKVEVFADGRVQYSDGTDYTGRTGLSENPLSELAEVDADPEFTAAEIDEDAFERIWDRAVAPGAEQPDR